MHFMNTLLYLYSYKTFKLDSIVSVVNRKAKELPPSTSRSFRRKRIRGLWHCITTAMVATRSQSRKRGNEDTTTSIRTKKQHTKQSSPLTTEQSCRPALDTSVVTNVVDHKNKTNLKTKSLRQANTTPSVISQPSLLSFALQPAAFGLIQERIHTSLYALLVQAILWNQTRGIQARPILFSLLTLYPTPESLSHASLSELTTLLQPLGLHNIRAARLIALANAWVAAPPDKNRRYRRLHYPCKGDGADVKPGEVLGCVDGRVGWEVAHLPGMGAYALDSFRIFYRDRLREVNEYGSEEEWRSVLPMDKDLRAYLVWRWEKEGWKWNWMTGEKVKIKGVLKEGGVCEV